MSCLPCTRSPAYRSHYGGNNVEIENFPRLSACHPYAGRSFGHCRVADTCMRLKGLWQFCATRFRQINRQMFQPDKVRPDKHSFENTRFIAAAERGELSHLKRLYWMGADPQQSKKLALLTAAKHGNWKVLSWLLKKSIEFSLDLRLAIQVLAEKGQGFHSTERLEQIFSCLFQESSHPDEDRQLAIQIAVQNGQWRTVDALIGKRQRNDFIDLVIFTLGIIVNTEQTEAAAVIIIKDLSEALPSQNFADNFSDEQKMKMISILKVAVEKNHLQTVPELLKIVPVNSKFHIYEINGEESHDKEKTMLEVALLNDRVDMAALLLEHGASPTEQKKVIIEDSNKRDVGVRQNDLTLAEHLSHPFDSSHPKSIIYNIMKEKVAEVTKIR